MANDGEPPEITALTTNLSSITEAVTAGGSPQWFADRLVERAFITRGAARGIRDTPGISPAVQASRLMDSVFAKINGSDDKSHWFDEFVDIFSHDRTYAELVERLKHTTSTAVSGSRTSEYAICSYYIPKKRNVFEVHIVVVPNHDLLLEGVRKEYNKKGDKGPNTIAYIEEEAISLSLTKDSGVSEVNRHGWELRLLVQPPTLRKSILDSHEKGKLIPHFELTLTLRDERNPQSFEQEVHFTGTEEPTSIVLSRDPATPEVFPVIRGAEILAQTTVEITPDQSLEFHWEGHGFRVYIPAGAVSRRVTLCIQASLIGDYQLPDDGVLVSGVYWLSLHPHIEELHKKVTLTLQHCGNDDSSASIVTTRCTQEAMPYKFKKLPEASFSVPKEGTIQVDHFSGHAVTAPSISEYAICSYYIPKNPNVFDVHITVTPNLALQLQCVKKEYCKKGDKGPTTTVYIEEEAISLSLTTDSGVTEVNRLGWELTLLVQPPTLRKSILDSHKKGKLIPHFELYLKLRDKRNPQSFKQDIHFTGTEEPTFITLIREPQTPEERKPSLEMLPRAPPAQEIARGSTYTPTPSREPGDTHSGPTRTDSGRAFPVIRGADIVAQTTVEITPDKPRNPDTPTPGEPPEITALKTNREVIIDTVSVGGTLQWFADCLVAKAFIADKTARGRLSIHGITAAEKASQLMDGVFAKINGSDNKKTYWFREFINIFVGDRAHQDLVEKLRKAGKTLALLLNIEYFIIHLSCIISVSGQAP